MIVESPAKAATIKKYLEKIDPTNTYTVKASFGHVRDLKQKELGIDIERGFVPNYCVLVAKLKVVSELVSLAKTHKLVYLASDGDREGESIAWQLMEILPKENSYKRITFNEITPTALKAAISSPRDIDMNLVNAQQTRRFIDRIVGFKVSPLLWKHYKTANGTVLSAGRVQSAALKLIVDKEKEIDSHQSNCYWNLGGKFILLKGVYTIDDAKLYFKEGICKLGEAASCRELLGSLRDQFVITGFSRKGRKEYPDPPFITSSMQQEAYNKLGMTASQTMKHAQDLYESGLITYMRTDSTTLSDTAHTSIRNFVITNFGADYYTQRSHSKKVKNAQEAHEAIRPTHFDKSIDEITKKHSPRHAKLYELIKYRALASQMKEAVYEDLLLSIKDASFSGKYEHLFFQGKVTCLKFPGFLRLYGTHGDKNAISELDKLEVLLKKSSSTSQVRCECKTILAHNIWSSAPSRYNEPALIKVLEKEGIGRPSTYASILTKLFEKQYITKANIEGTSHESLDLIWAAGKITEKNGTYVTNAEKGRLMPTQVGKTVNEYMESHFPDIASRSFTAQMEDKLDDIANGEIQHNRVLYEFWGGFKDRVAQQEAATIKKQALQCEKREFMINGCTYTIRIAKYGPVIEYGEKKFIGLKAYLQLAKKSYNDITEDEVRFLAGLPYRVIDGDGDLAYGQYGFYVKLNGDTAPVTQYWLKSNYPNIIDIKNISEEQVRQLIDAKIEFKKKSGIKKRAKKKD